VTDLSEHSTSDRPKRAAYPGLGFALGTLAAAVAAIPAALRAGFSPAVWITLAGASALLLGPALAGLARARPVTGALFAALTALGLCAIPLAFLATLLKTTTHHRPLGAVTFAVAAALLVSGAMLATLRLVAWTRPLPNAPNAPNARAWLRAAVALAALAGPAFLFGSVLSAAGARSSALDVVLALGSAILLGIAPWPRALRKVASRAGLPIWVTLVGLGVSIGLSGASSAARLASPALFAPIGWFVD
jgi:hypothetical protein